MESNEQSKEMFLIASVFILLLIGSVFWWNASKSEVPTDEGSGSVVEVDSSNNQAGNGGEVPPADTLTVSYTNEGFSPFVLEVNAGDTVNFVNNTQGTMWVTSEAHPTADQHYPEFGMSKSIGPGEVYEFQFTLLGSWGYKNLNNEKHLGAIVVIPQDRQ